MENENDGPINYCGASAGHVIASRFLLKQGEPLKLFGREDADDSITWLDLSDSKGVVDDTTFTLLTGLRHLYIDNCQFEQWLPGVFSALKCFNSLTISNSKLILNSDSFSGNNTLESLSLSDFEEIGSNIFTNLSRLEQLTFERCKFSNLSKDTFSGLEKVTYLKISECELLDVSSSAFEAMENLDMLIFNDNKIVSMDWNSFLKLNNLTELSFHDNTFDAGVHYDIFQKLPKLESILFETELYKDLDFDGFPVLKKVNLSTKQSDDLDEIIEKIKSKNLEYELVLCGKVEIDMDDMQICA